MNKTEIVKTLMEYEKQNGLEETLHYFFEKNINVRIGFSAKACDAPIEELMLSVRSYNALRRAGLTTLGDLVERLNEGGLKDVRNLGARSYKEIQTRVLVYGFDRLGEKDKAKFFCDLMQNNK